jgi:hypothetical protein
LWADNYDVVGIKTAAQIAKVTPLVVMPPFLLGFICGAGLLVMLKVTYDIGYEIAKDSAQHRQQTQIQK